MKKGEFVRMAKNPNWYGKEPAMDEVIFRIFADAEAQYQALNAGELDAVDDVPVADLRHARSRTATSRPSPATRATSASWR